jgi:hypothetical protein
MYTMPFIVYKQTPALIEEHDIHPNSHGIESRFFKMFTTQSSSSTSLSTTTNSISTMATTFASIPIHHAVTIKLTKKNYLLWRAQLLPYLRSTNLMGYLDGSTLTSAKQVAQSTAAGVELVSNPTYTA